MSNNIRLYFAYGSNLNLVQLHQKCSNPSVLGIARLPGHRLGFHGYSSVWDGAVETVIPDNQSEVWGVLYQLTAADWEQLDNHEDVRDNGTGTYFHYPVEVYNEQQELATATIYKKALVGPAELPSTEYLTMIVQGAIEQGLPAEYLASLQKLKSKGAIYAVPHRRRSSTTAIVTEDCSGCSS